MPLYAMFLYSSVAILAVGLLAIVIAYKFRAGTTKIISAARVLFLVVGLLFASGAALAIYQNVTDHP